jgi:hypothetical protein
MKPKFNSGGYPEVDLLLKGKVTTKRVHRLVAELFLDNPDDLPVVNHKDGVKSNIHVDNLEWCDYSHNNKHAYDTGLNDRTKRVCQYDLQGNFIKSWDSIQQASDSLGIQKSGISKCVLGKLKTSGKFIWKEEIINE